MISENWVVPRRQHDRSLEMPLAAPCGYAYPIQGYHGIPIPQPSCTLDGTGDEWQSQVPGVGPLSVDSPLGIFQNAVYATPRGFNTKVVQLWMI